LFSEDSQLIVSQIVKPKLYTLKEKAHPLSRSSLLNSAKLMVLFVQQKVEILKGLINKPSSKHTHSHSHSELIVITCHITIYGARKLNAEPAAHILNQQLIVVCSP